MKPLMLLSVHAGVIVNGKVVELHQAIGHVWQPPAGGQDDAKVRQKAQDVCAQVEAQAMPAVSRFAAGCFTRKPYASLASATRSPKPTSRSPN